jgi:nitrite reductase (NADH) small subunit
MNWIRITAAENIPPREGRTVQLGSLQVAIFNTGGRFLAVENRCPHSGGPLADGIVGGDAGAPPVRTFPVEVVDGIVMLACDQARIAA